MQSENEKLVYDFIKSLHPEWTEAKIRQSAQQSLETKMAKSGFRFTLQKSKESYNAIPEYEFKKMPAIVVDLYENGTWKERKLCTAPMVLEEPDNYDKETFMLLIHALSEERYIYDSEPNKRRLKLIVDLAAGLKKKFLAEEEARKKLKELTKEEVSATPMESNWDKKNRWMFGKSYLLLKSEPLQL